jgi:hypothetical protein
MYACLRLLVCHVCTHEYKNAYVCMYVYVQDYFVRHTVQVIFADLLAGLGALV